MSFREKIKQIFRHRQISSPATFEPTPAPGQLPNHSSSTSFPTFAIKKTKTNATTKTARETQRREKKERKEQKKRDKAKNSKPKIELYKPHEIPPSKYRGARDEAHQQRLNAYTFDFGGSSARVAQVSSPELSPRATMFIPAQRGVDMVLDSVAGDVVAGEFIILFFIFYVMVVSRSRGLFTLLLHVLEF